MNWFKNLKISMKLSLGFATMVFLMGALAFNGYRSAMSIELLLTETLDQRVPITNLILSADRDLQQMLVAERSLVFSEVGSETYKSLLKDYQENKEQAKTRWGKAAALFSGQQEIASAKQFESDWATWAPLSAQVLELIQTGNEDDKQQAINLSLGGTADAFEAMRANIDNVQDLNDKTIASYQENAKALHKQVVISNVLFLAIAVGMALAFAFFITGSITGPIRRGVELAEFIAVGDLRQRLRLSQKDEIGQLGAALDKMADSLNDSAKVAETIATGDLSRDIEVASQHDRLGSALRAMLENLRSMVNEIQQSGEQIASGANQVSDSSQALSQGATESASSLEEVSASMQQLTEQVRVNSENASSANQLSGTSKQAAEKGNKQMEQMVAAMEEISQSSQNISRIIKVIDEIAFQTNLLALNAAVEAARAGQHGKGFAVVAEEVRNLAARSAKAAEETTQLIKSSVDLTQNGTSMAQQTSTALKEIREGTIQVADLLEEIAAASQEQAQGIDQINQGLLQIDSVTQQNTASAEESAAAAQELSSQAETLRQMLTRFILDGRNKPLSLT